jgi:Ran GTPase-activating protein (RanGAP) involved in mRNA processing and transport
LIGETVVQTCMAPQFNTSINSLYLINADFEAIRGAETLRDMLKTNVDLRDLNVCESSLEDTGITILSDGLLENSTLQHLNLRSNSIGLEGARCLANLVKTGTSLIELKLAMNNIGNVGAEALAQGLQRGVLQQLDLSDNGITAEGGCALAEMLRTNTSIHELILSFNSIGDAGAASIANILEVNTTLKCLFLSRCNMTNKGAYAVAWKLPRMRGLKELVMTKNSVDHKGVEALLQGLRFNMELEYLHVEDKVSTPTLREIVFWIRLNRAGRRIFRNTGLQSTLWPKVLSRVNHDMDVLFHFLSEKPDVFHHGGQCRISTL